MRILLSAFEPYDKWEQNSSWEALTRYLRDRGVASGLTTRRYPVDLHRLQERLNVDLELGFDAVLHLGQAPGVHQIHLEAIALNVAGMIDSEANLFGPLIPDGPVAFRTAFPLDVWCNSLLENEIPASISYHAGTYLCNAVMYLSHYWHLKNKRSASIGFVHLPLTPNQVLRHHSHLPSMSIEQTSLAVHTLIESIRSQQPSSSPSVRSHGIA